MTAENFMMLLTICSVVSSLLTEAIKKAFGGKDVLPWNIVVLIISMIVGIVVMTIYYSKTGAPTTMIYFFYSVIMGIANWVCAMVGYDKVKQALEQFNN